MRKIAFFLLLAPLVYAEEFVDKSSGLKINVPDDWRRDPSREKETIRFSAVCSVSGEKYTAFVVHATKGARNFSADDWLDAQEKLRTGYLDEVKEPFKRDTGTTVGGLSAIGFTIGGKQKGRDAQVRFRVYAVLSGEYFFQIEEVSVNGAYAETADAVKAIWDGVGFLAAETEKPAAVEGKAQEIVDPKGNLKFTIPPGWDIEQAPDDNEKTQLRLHAVRRQGDDIAIHFQIFRMRVTDSKVFASWTPDQVLQRFLVKNSKFFEPMYGPGTSESMTPQLDEGTGLAGAKKAGAYELSGLHVSETQRIVDAENQIRKGIKGVKVPEFKPLVTRGRIAMVSPYVYFTCVIYSARDLANDSQCTGEVNAMHESIQFIAGEALPAPLVVGKPVGNTFDNPENAKERTETVALEARASKTYRIEYTVKLPKGLVLFKGQTGETTAMVVYGQDARNNWVEISIQNISAKKLSEERLKFGTPQESTQTWRSNWTGKARDTKVPDKVENVSLGKVKGKGFKKLEGTVDGFPATFIGVVSDKVPGKGWRTLVSVETRGDEAAWEDAIKDFFKKLKAKDVKVK